MSGKASLLAALATASKVAACNAVLGIEEGAYRGDSAGSGAFVGGTGGAGAAKGGTGAVGGGTGAAGAVGRGGAAPGGVVWLTAPDDDPARETSRKPNDAAIAVALQPAGASFVLRF